MYRNCQKIQNCVGIVWGIVRIFTDLGNNSDNSEFSDSLACARAKPQNSGDVKRVILYPRNTPRPRAKNFFSIFFNFQNFQNILKTI